MSLVTQKKYYTVIDIETTGGLAKRDRITEIAIVKTDGKNIIDTYESLINPGRSIPPQTKEHNEDRGDEANGCQGTAQMPLPELRGVETRWRIFTDGLEETAIYIVGFLPDFVFHGFLAH